MIQRIQLKKEKSNFVMSTSQNLNDNFITDKKDVDDHIFLYDIKSPPFGLLVVFLT